MNFYTQDQNFLKQICHQQNQIIYAKIYLLNFNEQILRDFTGVIQSGSINLDGESSVRRTCQLTLQIDNINNQNLNLVLNSKIKIDIGIKNLTNQYLENDIIWFPMGLFYLTNFSLTNSLKTLTVNIQGKDKMVKLTGEIGGSFNSIIDFGTIEVEDKETGKFNKESLKLKTIIQEMIHTYGQEPYEKIFIYDLDDYGLNLISYIGDEPIYVFLKDEDEKIIVVNYVFDENYIVKTQDNEEKKLSELTSENKDFFISKYNILNEKQEFNYFYLKDDTSKIKYYIKKCEKGDIVGYELTELIYNNDLLGAVGESVTTILDKIKNMLGTDNYEYYYDIDGNFIFKKQDSFAKIESYLNPFVSFSKPTFNFNNNELVSNISESFDLSKIKNDFTIWGNKGTSKDSNLQFHARIAIDKKPKKYITININEDKERELKEKYPNLYNEEMQLQQKSICYSVNEKEESWSDESTWKQVDWREIIYQMAQDYKKFNQLSDFYQLIENENPEYVNGITGYERYYIDLDGFWRTLYSERELVNEIEELNENYYYYIIDNGVSSEGLVVNRDEEIGGLKDKQQEFDIRSFDLKNQMIYRKKYNEIGTEFYEEIGNLDDIIETNYKILLKMYQICNKKHDKDFLLSKDIDTGTVFTWNRKKGDIVRLLEKNADKKIIKENISFITNKIWSYLKEGETEAEVIGTYYDLIGLYIRKENLNYDLKSVENDSLKVEYKEILKYPVNKNNQNLTDLQNIEKDSMGLLLWAQMNSKLEKIEKIFDDKTRYNKYIYTDPSKLFFWFDFLDNMTFSDSHSISAIGPREYVKNNTEAKTIANFNIYDNIFLNYNKQYTKDEEKIREFFKTPFAKKRQDIPFFRLAKRDESIFNMAAIGISALELINNYIYNYNYMASSVTINAIPQYFLQPNTLLELIDLNQKKIIKYIIKKISFSFNNSFNGQMSINGSKLVDENYVQQDLRKEFLNE